MDLEARIDRIRTRVQERFQGSERVLSFEEYLTELFREPALHLRTAAQYLVEMIDHFGWRPATRIGQEARRFNVFDLEADGHGDVVTGQERVQNELYQNLLNFARRGKSDKMLLLHGPNGSGKTTVIEALMRGLEIYSQTPQGAAFTFNWVFTEREGALDRIGFDPRTVAEDEEELASYAHLDQKDIAARIGCELRDPPIFLVPKDERRVLIDEALEAHPPDRYVEFRRDWFLEGDLCQKCRRIYEALLVAYQGDWNKVIRHVQVERFAFSKRYRSGAVSIEPQGNIDGGARPIITDQSYSIPPALKNVSLYEPVGDVIDANRGVLEYSDFLKRPLETNKYLLTTCERGTVSLQNCLAYLDMVIMGTANETQLSVFKRSPDFSSFKARIELIPVPYLLRWSAEADLYRRHIRAYSRGRHLAPHSEEVAALWAVLSRLRRPDSDNYDAPLREAVTGLTPLEKAKLYDAGEAPGRFTEEQRKLLRASILRIRREFEETEGEFEGIFGAEYEGRRGVSPREMMTVLSRAAQNPYYDCLTPMAVFDAIEELIRDTSVYDFLRLPAEKGYRDMPELLDAARQEHLRWVTDEVYSSISLIDESEYDRVFLDYFRHVKAYDAKEQVYNPNTGTYEAPDEAHMESIEQQIGISEPAERWRSNVMTRIAAWSLDHSGETLDYQRLFPEVYEALRARFYRERNRILTLIEQDILKYGTDEFELLSPSEKQQVLDALHNMKERYGYCDNCARSVIAYVLGLRSRMETEEAEDAEEARAGRD